MARKVAAARCTRIITLLIGIALAATLSNALAQTQRKLPKIGELWFQDQKGAARYQRMFRNALRDLGYEDGKSAVFVARFAGGDPARLPGLLRDVMAQQPDVIWVTPRAMQDAKQMNSSTPMLSFYSDPDLDGVGKGLTKPTGHLTGISWQTLDTAGKRLQHLRELLPGLTHAGLLYDPGDPGALLDANALQQTAAANLRLVAHTFANAAQLAAAFTTMQKQQVPAVVVVHCPLAVHHQSDIARLAAQARLPFISEGRDFAQAGALVSFGPSIEHVFQRSALYAHKILQGAKPADLPIEQPMVFQLVINEKTAKALGIKIPESILIRADEVIR